VTRVNAEEIVALQIKLTEITTDLESLVNQHEDIDDQQIKLRQKIVKTQQDLRTQLHYLGQLARTNAK
jgi:peptidoglycan hydrolase CwlO-like protein